MQNGRRKLSAVTSVNDEGQYNQTFKTKNGAYSIDTKQEFVALINGRPFISIDSLFDNGSMPSHVLREVGINSYIRIDDFGVDDFSAFEDLSQTPYVN